MEEKELREAYDALTSGILDTTDIEPYMHTITEALQIAAVKLEFLEEQRMIGKMEMATAVRIRLDARLSRAEISKFIEEFLDEYRKWFDEHRKGRKDG